MWEMEIVRDERVIAQEINEIKDRVRETMIDGAIEIGKRLCEAKEMVPVGSWGQWLKDNVDYSERTAQNLMRCFEEYGKRGLPEALQEASLTNALALLGLPEDIKHELIDSGAAVDMSARELKAEIARLKQEREEAQQNFLDQLELSQAAHQDALDQLKAADSEMRDLRERALLAQSRAMQQAEQLEESERLRKGLEIRLREEQLRKPQEPTVIVEDTPETLKRLAVLEARAKESESANAVLFRDAYSRLCETYNRCFELIELIAREDGDSAAEPFRRAMARTASQMSSQQTAHCAG